MKEVFAFITAQQQTYAQLPLFKFMADTRLTPEQRLAWVPCAAPLIMNFADLNKYVFRQEPADSALQALINTHTYEEESHWHWFIKDLESLGLNYPRKLSDTLRFLWSSDTQASRHICQRIAMITYRKDPHVVLAAIECLEATWYVFLPLTLAATREIQRRQSSRKFYFFGDAHQEAEAGHSMDSEEIEQMLSAIQLTDQQQADAMAVVEEIFAIFTDFAQELYAYAEAQLDVSVLSAA